MVEKIIDLLKEDPKYKDRIEHIEILPARDPVYGQTQEELSDNITNYLSKKKYLLYRHQCQAIDCLKAGRNIIITTPTASGKTLAFNIPIFERLSQDKNATALYLYPTKALSNDQLKVMKEFEELSDIKVNPDIYDGDTPPGKRPRIRESSRIIISNPHEIHQILALHNKWQKFFKNLKFIVIDEAHQYRGVFGSNVAFVIRRLRRICNFYGSKPQFILSTATLANPVEFGEKLTGLHLDLISEDGSPKGKKYFILYNPYFNEFGDLSAHQETMKLFLYFIRNGLQTLCFTVSRDMAELIIMWAKKEIKKPESYLKDKITAYRAGYLPEERREIEKNLKSGDLVGITSTNALEVGIDIGSLDSVIISGYPGTIVSTWQQAGRAGRGTNESIASLVAFQNPLDQYFMKHPQIFFGKSHENAVIDLFNPHIISGHILCAASELPIELRKDKLFFGEYTEDILKALASQNLVQNTPNGWVYSSRGRAAEFVQLDNISSDIFKVICDGELIETMDRTQAYREAHEGAILVHQGETHIVENLDLRNSIIEVKKKEVGYYTDALKITDIKILKAVKNRKIGNFKISFGDVEVNESYVRYRIMKYDKPIGFKDLNLPPLKFKTKGLWFSIPENIREKVEDKLLDFAGGLHGIEHAMIGVMPFHVMCDARDISVVSIVNDPFVKPMVVIYDGFEEGIGLAEKAFELIVEIMAMALELVSDCKCEKGCPRCIYSSKYRNENKPLDKKATIVILNELLMLTGAIRQGKQALRMKKGGKVGGGMRVN